MIYGTAILILTVVGFPFWMVLVGFRVGDIVEARTKSMDAGALAAVCTICFLPILLVLVGVSILASSQ